MNELLLITVIPVLRAVAGWLQISLEDNKISLLEWRKLVKTVLRLGVPSLALFYGFALDVEFAIAIPVIVDYVFEMVVKAVKKTQ